jgi:hypothetical protein
MNQDRQQPLQQTNPQITNPLFSNFTTLNQNMAANNNISNINLNVNPNVNPNAPITR